MMVKPHGNKFTRCSKRDFLQHCISKYPRDCPKWWALLKDRTQHINHQNACYLCSPCWCKEVFGTWGYASIYLEEKRKDCGWPIKRYKVHLYIHVFNLVFFLFFLKSVFNFSLLCRKPTNTSPCS
jgi:hypothetical protein